MDSEASFSGGREPDSVAGQLHFSAYDFLITAGSPKRAHFYIYISLPWHSFNKNSEFFLSSSFLSLDVGGYSQSLFTSERKLGAQDMVSRLANLFRGHNAPGVLGLGYKHCHSAAARQGSAPKKTHTTCST